MHVIATAGHVDHGKSTLIRGLTGMEPDRWAEERRRGLTIDLGYAWTTLPDGTQVAFVDVPGHHRFVTNMLAGVGPVPTVLFVVAADQGWSAQSTEHLDALGALDVRHGVLAISRCDLGDPELAESEARDCLAGSPLADLEAVLVSPVAGFGMDALRAALVRMTRSMPAPVPRPTRLWIDRVFTIRGAGTVVTGTLSSGTVRVGDEMEIRPSGALVRIRALESLHRPVHEASAVSRVAVNLRGVRPTQLRRGDALTAPGGWRDVSVLDVRLSVDAEQLPSELVLHVGSAAVHARVRPLASDLARLSLATPLAVHIGERLVLRDPGRQRVAAGARVLDTMPPMLRRRGAARRRADELAEVSGEPDPVGEVRRRGAVRRGVLAAAGVPVIGELAGTVSAGGWLIDTACWRRWSEVLRSAVEDWAAARPMQPGMPRRAAVERVGLPDGALLDLLVVASEHLVVDARGVHRRGVAPTLPAGVEQQLQQLLDRFDADPLGAPEVAELVEAGLTERVLATVVGDGRLLRIAAGVYLPPGSIEQAAQRVRALAQPFTASQARQAWGTTRRVAVPLLEYLDAAGVTQRVDDQRRCVRDGGGGRESNPPDRATRSRRL
jgi:selenocysteine-specific elongation factor